MNKGSIKIKKVLKYFFLGLISILILFLTFYYKELIYGIGQARGQISIMWNTRPVSEVLADVQVADSIKQKIRLIDEIKAFAKDSLGLDVKDQYTSFYDQKGKPILWIVTASEPFDLKAFEWSFPIAGSFSYKGFFDYEKAVEEERKMSQKGFDTSIDEVGAWSTLGFFSDPILSGMLNKSPGALADLFIHELTHSTLYAKDNVEFNENLASFVGYEGALLFLKSKYGPNSPELKDFQKSEEVSDKFADLVLAHSDSLKRFYKTLGSAMSLQEKIKRKEIYLTGVTTIFRDFLIANGKKIRKKKNVNNTFFLDYQRYLSKQDEFKIELNTKFNGNFKRYLDHLKKRYPLL